MADFKDTDLVCVTRYCPNCGTEIFCRSDYERHRVFYMSEDMGDPTTECSQCRFNLMLLPVEELLASPEPPREQGLLLPRVQGGRALVDALHQRNLRGSPDQHGSDD